MTDVITGIGVVSGILGIISFGQDNFASTSGPQTAVRLAAGLNGANDGNGGGKLDAADGSVAVIKTFNAEQQFQGNSGSVHVNSGGFTDTGINQETQDQAKFIQVTASNDALCLAYASATWVDGSKWLWLGDFGQACGLKWFFSDITIGKEEDGTGHVTKCTWLDADNTVSGDSGALAAILEFKIDDFGNKSKEGGDPASVCGFPSFRAWSDTEGKGSIFKRDGAKASKQKHDPRLVITKNAAHNATELCTDDNSYGPDLVSLSEGKYCNMETREILPLCDTKVKVDCFDVNTRAVVKETQRVKGVRALKSSVKSFSKVLEWGY